MRIECQDVHQLDIETLRASVNSRPPKTTLQNKFPSVYLI